MSVLGSLGFGSEVSTATTRVGLKPGCTANKSQKLRSRRPAATISTSESANSPMTRIWRARERPSEPLEPRPSCRSVLVKSLRLMSHAGASPKMVPAAMETATANASTPQLIDMSFRCGRLAGTNCSRNFRVKKRMAKPAIPPSRKSSRLSVRSWRMRRFFLRSQRLANRDLTTAPAGPGQQQIGDVDATDQQYQSYCTEEQNERLANAADHGFAERNQPHGPFGLCRILCRILPFQRFNQRIEVRLRGRNRETGLQARDDHSTP